jgi:hypothetical protein
VIIDDVLSVLDQKKRSLRCSEMGALLASLGFRVRDGKLGGHKTFSHPGLQGFSGGGYNCGHKAGSEIKLPYVLKVASVIRLHRDELEKWLEKGK